MCRASVSELSSPPRLATGVYGRLETGHRDGRLHEEPRRLGRYRSLGAAAGPGGGGVGGDELAQTGDSQAKTSAGCQPDGCNNPAGTLGAVTVSGWRRRGES